MKIITKSKKAFLLICLFSGIALMRSQPTCTLQISYSAPTGSSNCNGSASVINTGAMCSGANYSWSNGATGTSVSNLCPGTYDVIATAPSAANCCSIAIGMFTIPISSVTPCNLNANFTYSAGANGFVAFNNTSTGTVVGTTYSWNFGDATGNSQVSPAHTYSNGTYSVRMIAVNSLNPFCVDSVTQIITISNSNTCTANASFSMSPSGTPQFWNAFPTVPNNVTAASWNWGDGSSSNTLFTSHSYSAAGSYDICLSVTVSCGSSTSFCNTYAIYRPAQDMAIVQVNVINPATVGLKNHDVETTGFSVYPNPNNGYFNLNGLKNGPITVIIFNLVGKQVYQFENTVVNGSLVKNVDLNGISDGVYFIKINSDGKVLTTKLVIETGN